MTIKQLEEQLNRSIDMYHSAVVSNIDSFDIKSDEEKILLLTDTLDDMNRQAFYTFVEFKDSILKYAKELEGKR